MNDTPWLLPTIITAVLVIAIIVVGFIAIENTKWADCDENNNSAKCVIAKVEGNSFKDSCWHCCPDGKCSCTDVFYDKEKDMCCHTMGFRCREKYR